MFQFSCRVRRFAFYQFFVFQPGHWKYREFWRRVKQTRKLWRCSVKETKFWSKICMNVKVATLSIL